MHCDPFFVMHLVAVTLHLISLRPCRLFLTGRCRIFHGQLHRIRPEDCLQALIDGLRSVVVTTPFCFYLLDLDYARGKSWLSNLRILTGQRGA
ncbi:hypothetical protein CF70_011295 [Cupriavidus sp. SK-3]|nr:hypothetical protein CF70_011295 [Cupriavidus sp. SK-3]